MKNLLFDIGGTSIKYGVCVDGRMIAHNETPTEAHLGGSHILEKLKSLISRQEGYDAIGISTAGQVNSQYGSIIYANSNIPGYTGMELRRELEALFSVPVMVENDVNCAAMGEAAYGAGRNFRDFLCLTYGTGVGGAIILNGSLYHGASFSAGEFGGIVTHGSVNRSDGSGDVFAGCYERFASTSALVREAGRLDPSLDSGRAVFARLEEPPVREIVERWTDEVLLGLVTLIHIFNPSCVVLGGGVMSQPFILQRLRAKLSQKIMPSFSPVQLLPAELGNLAGMLGANFLTEQYVKNK